MGRLFILGGSRGSTPIVILCKFHELRQSPAALVLGSESWGGSGVSYIFVVIFFAALFGIFRPFIKGATRWHFGVAAIVSFVLIGVFAPNTPGPKNTESEPTETVLSDRSATGPSEPSSKWDYSDSKDEMRGTTTKFASLNSENTVDLQFPYGEVHGQLWIRRRPEDGLNVAFEVEKGQVLCHSFSDDYVSIKFDDGPIQRFRCTSSSDGSSETAFLLDEQRALAGLKHAKRTIVEAEFYQQGRQQFVFDTAGLDWK